MAHSDDRAPTSLLVAGMVGLVALVATWLLVIAGRPRPVVLVAASVAAAGAVVAAVQGRRWMQLSSTSARRERDLSELAQQTGHTSDVLLRLTPGRSIRAANAGLRSVFGHEPSAWNGRDALDLVAADDTDEVASAFERATTDDELVEIDADLPDAGGEHRRVRLMIAPIADGGYLLTLRDVTEQHRLVRQLSHRAFHDDLTGVANRARFVERLESALASELGRVAVLFVDLDDFKAINDGHGHAAGDEVLRTLAERIVGWVRPTDTVARLGGDEFAVLLTGVDATSARHVAEQLAPTLAEPIDVNDTTVLPGASIGVAVADADDTVTTLLQHADAAMYRAKRAGKGRVHVYDPAVGTATSTPISAELHGAPERGELRVVYLPVVELAQGRVVGVEALLRWDHPDRGLLTAAEFLGAAERSGDMDALGRWAIERAIDDAATWQASGLQLAVNVSATQLDAPDFADVLATALDRHDLGAASLTVEIPEAALVGSAARTRTIESIRRLGCRLAVDGFAATQTPLQTIADHGIETLKLAPELSAPPGVAPRDLALVGSIVAWATSMGIATVGLAIEQHDQIATLRRLGCVYGQGTAICQPLMADAVLERVGA